MADFISEDYVKNRLPRLLKGSDELKVRDDRLKGFMVRARRGADDSILRTFMIEYIVAGTSKAGEKAKRKTMQVGTYPTMKAEEAREAARKFLQSAKDGTDPQGVRAQKLAAPKLEEVWGEFQREHLALKEPATQKDYAGRYRRIIEPTFKGRRIAEITRGEVDAMRVKFRKKPTDLNRALAVLSKLASFSMVKGYRHDNPVSKVARFTEEPNETWLDENQLGPFIKALGDVEGPMGDLLRFVAVTGWRITAARLLRWDQVDLARLEVKLGDKATKKTATHLSADAGVLIDRQGHRLGYVFSNSKGKEPIGYNVARDALAEVCKAAGVERITPHTLRRTLATHSAIHGATISELMQAFGWKSTTMASRYVKRSESIARRGVERAAGIVNVLQKPSATVEELGNAAKR